MLGLSIHSNLVSIICRKNNDPLFVLERGIQIAIAGCFWRRCRCLRSTLETRVRRRTVGGAKDGMYPPTVLSPGICDAYITSATERCRFIICCCGACPTIFACGRIVRRVIEAKIIIVGAARSVPRKLDARAAIRTLRDETGRRLARVWWRSEHRGDRRRHRYGHGGDDGPYCGGRCPCVATFL